MMCCWGERPSQQGNASLHYVQFYAIAVPLDALNRNVCSGV